MRPRAGRADGQDDPGPLARADRVRRPRQVPRRRPRGAALRVVHRRRREGAGRGPRPARCLVAQAQARLPHPPRGDGRAAVGAAEGPQVQPRPADGRVGGDAPAARVRRGHGGAAGAPRGVHRSFPGRARAARADRGLLRARVGGLPARAALRRRHRPGAGRGDARRGDRGEGPGRGVRRRQLQRARRRAGAQRVQPLDLRRRPLRGDARGEGALRPGERDEPRQDRRLPRDDRAPARPRVAAGAAACGPT